MQRAGATNWGGVGGRGKMFRDSPWEEELQEELQEKQQEPTTRTNNKNQPQTKPYLCLKFVGVPTFANTGFAFDANKLRVQITVGGVGWVAVEDV